MMRIVFGGRGDEQAGEQIWSVTLKILRALGFSNQNLMVNR